ncbi:MAG: LTA synthase family protein [Clostridia bacterium]|nr:LTA synthase family protein [Clostridia bacterium]
MKQRREKIKRSVLGVIFGIILLLALLAFFAASWYIRVFGVTGFDSILFTLMGGVGGTGGDLMQSFVVEALVPSVLLAVVIPTVLFILPKRKLVAYLGKKFRLCIYPLPKLLSILICLVLSVCLISSGAQSARLPEYLELMKQKSSLFEEYYVDPAATTIVFPENKQNLIYIFLESMEVSFVSTELGGGNDINAIPELYQLAKDHVNFSDNSGVGGFFSHSGSTWTIAAMVSQTSGVPLKVPIGVDGNSYGKSSSFLPGITNLTDVLHDAGYYQTLMVGSDANFGGRKQYYEQHGIDKIYDLLSARQEGVVPEDYKVWWGMEDAKLFEWAKQELLTISQQEAPFAFTMLTVDTHHIDGYVCEYCRNDYAEQYENVLACSSRQVANFVTWIQQQDFYENTTIVICGDHPTMDASYVSSNLTENYQRNLYNCFINAKATPVQEKNRICATIDMFPTTLAAIGCEIAGNRLGLGTNLFSGEKTLSEQMSLSNFNYELSKPSRYYERNFYVPKNK